MPVRRRSRSSGAGGGSGSTRSHRSPVAGDHTPTHLNHHSPSRAAADQIIDVAAAAGHDVAVVRVRTFTTKSGNVVNRGDSIKIRNRGAAVGSGRIAAGMGRASPGGGQHPGVQRSSSSDSRPTSPGATASSSSRTANGSVRDRREALSRHSSSRGGRSGSQSGDDVDQVSIFRFEMIFNKRRNSIIRQ